jgi:signal transduction histidine kinase
LRALAHHRIRILVVDDTPVNVELIKLILKRQGYSVKKASSGEECLQRLKGFYPDLILMDVRLPGIDGIEVTRRIRRNPHLRNLPILLMTSQVEEDSPNSLVVQGLDAGAEDFIHRPIAEAEMLARVRSLLRLKKSLEARDELMACLTHDLNTPLVANQGMLNFLCEGGCGELSAEAIKVLRLMQESNQGLQDLVQKFLAVSKFEAGDKKLNLSPVNLQKLLKDVVEQLQFLVAEGVSLSLEASREFQGDVWIEGDRVELHRVFTNLVRNAIKFTSKGFIKIRYRKSRSIDGIVIVIQDTGCGIPSVKQRELFRRFRSGQHRLDSLPSAGMNPRSGSGLGLYLTQLIVNAHSGQIGCQSIVGKGTIFTIRLPVKQ